MLLLDTTVQNQPHGDPGSSTASYLRTSHGAAVALYLAISLVAGSCGSSGDSDSSASALATPPEIRRNSAGRQPTKNIILLSIDTLRADHMSIYGYERRTTPEIDSWFSEGRVFEHAYTTESSTPAAMLSCLTGLLPYKHGVRLFYQKVENHVVTVADYLRVAGYQTAAIVSNSVLAAEAIGLDTRFDYFDDYVDEKEARRDVFERRAARTTDAALKWLDLERREDQPMFLWVHYIDPHGPYQPPPEGAPANFQHSESIEIDMERVPEYIREPGHTDGQEYVDLYDEEIAYMDQEVSRFLEGYQQAGLLDDSLIVFVADHGESMMDHELWFRHGHDVYQEVTRIPLLMRGVGVTAGRWTGAVSIADVAATILDAANLRAPDEFDGRSLFDPTEDRAVFAEATNPGLSHRAMWIGNRKWTLSLQTQTRPAIVSRIEPYSFMLAVLLDATMEDEIVEKRLQFFDLANDPSEQNPAEWTSSAEGRQLRNLAALDATPFGPANLDASLRGQKVDSPKVAPGVDSKGLERLKSLGYL